MDAETRAKVVADYNELVEGLEELSASTDAEARELLEETREQVAALAETLNADEHGRITVAPPGSYVKVMMPGDKAPVVLFPPPSSSSAAAAAGGGCGKSSAASEGNEKEESGKAASGEASGEAQTHTRAAPPELLCAPYEVYYDEREWYSCLVTAVVPPADPSQRTRYRAWILGYPGGGGGDGVDDASAANSSSSTAAEAEAVLFEQLRPWRRTAAAAEALRVGAACHAIDPATGKYAAAVVERLTIEGNVVVTFAETPNADAVGKAATATVKDAGAGRSAQLPLSHVRVGTFYPRLLKVNSISAEERAARRRAAGERRREQKRERKRQREAAIAGGANDWQALVGGLVTGAGGGGGSGGGGADDLALLMGGDTGGAQPPVSKRRRF